LGKLYKYPVAAICRLGNLKGEWGAAYATLVPSTILRQSFSE
jgi:hypothetical protein